MVVHLNDVRQLVNRAACISDLRVVRSRMFAGEGVREISDAISLFNGLGAKDKRMR